MTQYIRKTCSKLEERLQHAPSVESIIGTLNLLLAMVRTNEENVEVLAQSTIFSSILNCVAAVYTGTTSRHRKVDFHQSTSGISAISSRTTTVHIPANSLSISTATMPTTSTVLKAKQSPQMIALEILKICVFVGSDPSAAFPNEKIMIASATEDAQQSSEETIAKRQRSSYECCSKIVESGGIPILMSVVRASDTARSAAARVAALLLMRLSEANAHKKEFYRVGAAAELVKFIASPTLVTDVKLFLVAALSSVASVSGDGGAVVSFLVLETDVVLQYSLLLAALLQLKNELRRDRVNNTILRICDFFVVVASNRMLRHNLTHHRVFPVLLDMLRRPDIDLEGKEACTNAIALASFDFTCLQQLQELGAERVFRRMMRDIDHQMKGGLQSQSADQVLQHIFEQRAAEQQAKRDYMTGSTSGTGSVVVHRHDSVDSHAPAASAGNDETKLPTMHDNRKSVRPNSAFSPGQAAPQNSLRGTYNSSNRCSLQKEMLPRPRRPASPEMYKEMQRRRRPASSKGRLESTRLPDDPLDKNINRGVANIGYDYSFKRNINYGVFDAKLMSENQVLSNIRFRGSGRPKSALSPAVDHPDQRRKSAYQGLVGGASLVDHRKSVAFAEEAKDARVASGRLSRNSAGSTEQNLRAKLDRRTYNHLATAMANLQAMQQMEQR